VTDETPRLPETNKDKDVSRPATDVSRNDSPPQRFLEEEEEEVANDSRKIICCLAIAAVVLLLWANYASNSHFSKLDKKYEDLGKVSQTESQAPLPQQAVTAAWKEVTSAQELRLFAIDANGLHVFELDYHERLIIALSIGAAAVLVSLLVIALALKTMLNRDCAKPTFYVALCSIGLGIAAIVCGGAKYWSISDQIDQNIKSSTVFSGWSILSNRSSDERALLAGIGDMAEYHRNIFDKLYFEGEMTPSGTEKADTERLVLAPRDCHDSNYPYLAVVSCPFQNGNVQCLRVLPGSKIIEMMIQTQ